MSRVQSRIFEGGRDEWNRRLLGYVCAHPFQSWEWGEAMKALGWQIERLKFMENDTDIGRALVLSRSKWGKRFYYLPRGPVLDFREKSLASAVFEALKETCRDGIFLKINPPSEEDEGLKQRIVRAGYRPAYQHALHRETLTLNLRKSKDELWLQIRKRFRDYIRQAAREGLEVRTLNDENAVHEFSKLHQAMARSKKMGRVSSDFFLGLWRALQGSERLVLRGVFRLGRMVSGAIFVTGFKQVIYQWGTTERGKDPESLAAKLLHWDSAVWAQEQGYETYDFGGIDPERNPGVAFFKEGFGGEKKTYIGEFDWVGKAWLYRLYHWKMKN